MKKKRTKTKYLITFEEVSYFDFGWGQGGAVRAGHESITNLLASA